MNGREELAMAVSTGCGCAPDGLCESCQIVLDAVLAWLTDRLGDEGVREVVEAEIALSEQLMAEDYRASHGAEAAVTVIHELLTGDTP